MRCEIEEMAAGDWLIHKSGPIKEEPRGWKRSMWEVGRTSGAMA